MRLKYLLASLVILTVFSCKNELTTVDESILGYNYFPLEVGKYWIYKIDSTVVLNLDDPRVETSSYVKEEIVNTIVSTGGDTSFVLTRSVSSTLDGNFTPTDVWKVDLSQSNVIRVEENLRFIKMLFPIVVDEEWDGNLFDQKIEVTVGQNTIETYFEWGYKVLANDLAITLEGEDYIAVVEIQQADHEDEVNLRKSKEQYAPGVGLIKREMQILTTNCFAECDGLAWIDKAEKGFTLTQVLVEHN